MAAQTNRPGTETFQWEYQHLSQASAMAEDAEALSTCQKIRRLVTWKTLCSSTIFAVGGLCEVATLTLISLSDRHKFSTMPREVVEGVSIGLGVGGALVMLLGGTLLRNEINALRAPREGTELESITHTSLIADEPPAIVYSTIQPEAMPVANLYYQPLNTLGTQTVQTYYAIPADGLQPIYTQTHTSSGRSSLPLFF
jgi:hypothetical protein